MSFDWTGMTPEELELHFNPRAVVQNMGDWDAIFKARSDEARASLRHVTNLKYGPRDRQTIDVFPADDPSAPVLVFIHGGYWRARDKEEYAFVPGAFNPAGITTVLVEYDLCPNVTLDVIVDQILDAVEWIARNIGNHGGNPDRLYFMGHSAGAHLAAMALGHDWTTRGLPADLMKGVTLATGIYDPAPAMRISVNNDLHLTPEISERCNALKARPTTDCPILVTVGAAEPEGWIDQSQRYSDLYGGTLMLSEGDGHLALLLTHCDTAGDIHRAQLAQMLGN
jgi:arylformamidase